MKQPITSYMKIGLVHIMAYYDTIYVGWPVLETTSIIAEDDYFDVIEHTWIRDDDVKRQSLDIIKSSGLMNTDSQHQASYIQSVIKGLCKHKEN